MRVATSAPVTMCIHDGINAKKYVNAKTRKRVECALHVQRPQAPQSSSPSERQNKISAKTY